ncbi:MAG: DUF86 domain-containing protein [bacterium]|nr:DUF86 domain-containing protein [bacterium]
MGLCTHGPNDPRRRHSPPAGGGSRWSSLTWWRARSPPPANTSTRRRRSSSGRGRSSSPRSTGAIWLRSICSRIQDSIDLAAHWVADQGLRPPGDYAETFDLLMEKGIIDAQLAEAMRGATGLRNRIAHGYASVNHGRIYDEYVAGTAAVHSFLRIMAETAGL